MPVTSPTVTHLLWHMHSVGTKREVGLITTPSARFGTGVSLIRGLLTHSYIAILDFLWVRSACTPDEDLHDLLVAYTCAPG